MSAAVIGGRGSIVIPSVAGFRESDPVQERYASHERYGGKNISLTDTFLMPT
jgi:hypothetical protein